MRTKHLLMALALPGVFAACSQEDEFVSQVQGPNDDRPVVGVISLNIPEAPSTRWDWSSAAGFTFDDNDYIGAALMDTYNSAQADGDWDDKYDIVDYINTNYKYGYAQGWTNNDAVMSEGNYFFYMPYNEELKSRAGLELSVPVEQYAYDETAESPVADDTYSWKKNQMFIGYDDIAVDDQQATPQMVEVFAKPRFNINYTGTGSTEVERVVVTGGSGAFKVGTTLRPTGTVNSYNPINGNSSYDGALSASSNLAKVFQAYNAAVVEIADGEYELGEDESLRSPFYQNFGAFTATGGVVTSNFLSLNFVPAKEVTGLMVVPPTNISANALSIQVYTNKGLVTIDNLTGFDDVEDPVQGTGITYSNLDVLEHIYSGDGSKANAITINFADVDVEQPASVTVATTSQLESIIRWYEDPNGTYPLLTDDPKTLTINLTGDVELTETVYNAIKGNPNISFKFNTSTNNTLTIPAGIPADALSLLNTESTAPIVVEGEQSLANSGNAVEYKYNVEVAETGTLNVNGGKGITIAEVENNGAVNVNGVVTFTTVTNYNELTVNANATLTGKVLNYAIASTGTPTMYTAQAVLTNNGTLNLSTDSENQCTIVNNNDLYIQGAFTNDKEDAVRNGTNGYTGKIENADATNSYIYAKAAFTNKGDIDNVGAMYSQTGGTITNNGYIMAHDGATTYVTTNKDGAEIELEERDTETQVNTSEEGSQMSYTMKSSDLTNGSFEKDEMSDKYNTLKIGMNVRFNNESKLPESIVINAATNLTVTCVDGCSFTSITAQGGGRHMLRGTHVQTESLTVASGTVFQIPALSSFAVYGDTNEGTITNNGEVLVGGEFYSDIASEPATGTWSSAGDGSYTWGDAEKDFDESQTL